MTSRKGKLTPATRLRMHRKEVLSHLQRLSDPLVASGLARFGIPTGRALGVRAPDLRRLARTIGKDQSLSLQLWSTEILEARVLAALIGDPDRVSLSQMERWVRKFDSWGVCDACCGVLFIKTPFALSAARRWSRRKEEFVKRAGFVLMAEAAIHRKELKDEVFLPMLSAVRREAGDERNFVRKAVNWALRQIGKRNLRLNRHAVCLAEELVHMEGAAHWVGADAYRELTSAAVQRRLRKRAHDAGAR